MFGSLVSSHLPLMAEKRDSLCVDTSIIPLAVNNPPDKAEAVDSEAGNLDGSLKDASEISWYNSPTDEAPIQPVPKQKAGVYASEEGYTSEESQAQPHKKKKVSYCIISTCLF